MTEVNIPVHRLFRHLSVARAQRARALNKAVADFGGDSAMAKEVNTELAELDQALIDLNAIQVKRKK